MDNTDTNINHLESGLKRWIIEAAFAIMVISAICTTTSILNWMRAEQPLVNALLQTLGMVVIYWAYLRGMKKLSRPLTTLWWLAITLNLLGFLCSAFPAVDSVFGHDCPHSRRQLHANILRRAPASFSPASTRCNNSRRRTHLCMGSTPSVGVSNILSLLLF